MASASVLIVTALKEEFEAAKSAAIVAAPRTYGVTEWVDESGSMPYLRAKFIASDGTALSLALARPSRMGSPSTAPVINALAERLKPDCLAMCGVCAGNPDDVALGDVIIAEMAYFYDEGKSHDSGFEGDHRQSPMLNSWIHSAQDMTTDDLSSYGEASEEEAKFWLLDRLHLGDDPRTHFARRRYFPHGAWEERINKYINDDGIVARKGLQLLLTSQGISYLEQMKFFQVEAPKQLPFKLKVGPIASGNVVVKDGLTWSKLKAFGVRTVVGLEMEAAAVGISARQHQVPGWVVAKGVMDYADPRKDDRFKSFAAKSSAEVLYKFVNDVVAPWVRRRSEERAAVYQAARDRIETISAAFDRTAERIANLSEHDANFDADKASIISTFRSEIIDFDGSEPLTAELADRLTLATERLLRGTFDAILRSKLSAIPPTESETGIGKHAFRKDVIPPQMLDLTGLTTQIDLRFSPWLVRDQGPRSTTVAFACTAAIEHTWHSITGAKDDASEEFLYWAMKSKSGDWSDGATLSQASTALLEFGICEEALWPYTPADAEGAPPEPTAAAIEAGLAHRYFPNYIRNPRNSAQMVLDVLRRGKVVAISLPVFRDPAMPAAAPTNWTTPVGFLFGRVLNPPLNLSSLAASRYASLDLSRIRRNRLAGISLSETVGVHHGELISRLLDTFLRSLATEKFRRATLPNIHGRPYICDDSQLQEGPEHTAAPPRRSGLDCHRSISSLSS